MPKYTAKLGDKICALTARSTVGLRSICKQLRLPYSTVTDWVYNREHDIHGKYKQAKFDQLYCLQEEIFELRHDCSADFITVVKNGKSKQVQNREHLARTRLKISSAMMLITKLTTSLHKELQELQKHQDRNNSSLPHHTAGSIKTSLSSAPENVLKSATSNDLTPIAATNEATLQNVIAPHYKNSCNSKKNDKKLSSGAPENTGKLAASNDSIRVVASNEATSQNVVAPRHKNSCTSKKNDKRILSSGAPENTRKPATSKLFTSNETQHLSNTSLPFGEGRGAVNTPASSAPENGLKSKPGKPHKRILNSYFHAGRGWS